MKGSKLIERPSFFQNVHYFPCKIGKDKSGFLFIDCLNYKPNLTFSYTNQDEIEILLFETYETRKGHGTNLVLTLEEIAFKEGAKKVTCQIINSNECLKLFQKLGYEINASNKHYSANLNLNQLPHLIWRREGQKISRI